MEKILAKTSQRTWLAESADGEGGAIRAALAADIATSGDPKSHIGALRQVDFVMKDGQIL